MPPKIDNAIFEWLGEQLEPPPPPPPVTNKKWSPRQTPAQRKLWEAKQKHVLIWGPKGGSKCRSPNALVYTDSGLKRIGSLKPDNAKTGWNPLAQTVVSFDGEKRVFAETTGFWINESREALSCELDNGSELIGSPEHPIWVCELTNEGDHRFTYRSLGDILHNRSLGFRYWTPFVGQQAWKPFDYNTINGIKLTPNLGYAIGALVGDGSLNFSGDDRSVSFANTDSECINRVSAGLSEIGCRLNQCSNSKCQYLVLPAGKIKPLILSLGIAHLSYSKFIPDAIVESPKEVLSAFMRGLFDTDGCVTSYGKVSIVTVSKRLSVDIQDVLAAFGILSVRRSRKTSSGRPTWAITISGEHALRFGREIGFDINRKQERIREPLISKRCPSGYNHNRYGYPDPIRDICREAWRSATFSKSRINKLKYKNLCSFGSIPGRHKLKQIISIFGSAEKFAPFIISDHWLEVGNITPTTSDLYDLSVPGPDSFLASGTINHNSFGAGDKMIRHCYDNRNALCLILVRVQNMAVKGGVWDKLITEVLPRWRDGNTDRNGKKLDDGLGLHYSEVKFDANHCPFIWIQNKFGGWSMITVMSCPHANQLRQRIRGVEPSMVFVDELTSCDSVEYFESVAAQLGRRPQVKDVQQFIGACNPEDPDHWVYMKWFVECFDEDTGERDENFHDIFFPAEENRENLQPGYLEGLASVYGKNATEAARMIGGEWVSAPSGESIFQEVFSVVTHVRPLENGARPSKTEFLQPYRSYPLIVGIDSGIVHHAFIFMQRAFIDGKMKWLIFDEIVLLRRKLTYATIIPIVMRRIRWWFDTIGADIPMVWISDDSAIKFFRPGAGTYDALDMEREYEAYRHKINLPQLKIRAAPKFNGSVEASIRIEQTALAEDAIVISSRCSKVIAMYNRLECEKQKAGAPFDPKLASTPRRSDHLHVFAAGTYPKLAASIQPSLLVPKQTHSTQTLITVGA